MAIEISVGQNKKCNATICCCDRDSRGDTPHNQTDCWTEENVVAKIGLPLTFAHRTPGTHTHATLRF